MAAAHRYCTFWLDGMYFGVELSEVQELTRARAMTPVPLAPPAVRGLINLRGQVVLAIDLRRRLGLPERPGGAPEMNVVLAGGDGAVSLLVDDVGDVIEADAERFVSPPETLSGAARELIKGAVPLDGRLLVVLRADAVVRLADAPATED